MKIRIKFQKQGTVRFIGHLDVMRYFQKVMRRAEVDIRYSEGFSPHQIMSFASPLSVGLISHAEYVDIDVNSSGNSTGMVRRLNEVSAEGLEVLSYRELPETARMRCRWWQLLITHSGLKRDLHRRTAAV